MKYFLALILACVSLGCTPSRSSLLVNKVAPYTRFYLLNGETISLDQLKGKTVVLVFWASWCSKSRQLMSDLSEYQAKFSARHANKGADTVFLLASIDKSTDDKALKNTIRDLKLNAMQIAWSGNDVHDEAYIAFQGEDIPTIFIIDSNGKIIAAGSSVSTIRDALEGD